MSVRMLLVVSALSLLVVGCADSEPTASIDLGPSDGSASDGSATGDMGTSADASAADAGSDSAVAFTDAGTFTDGETDAALVSCVDTCGDGRCETRFRRREACLQGEAEMSTCTSYVADFSCHDAGF